MSEQRHYLLILEVTTTMLVTTTTTTTIDDCETGWTDDSAALNPNGNCFKGFNVGRTWHDARADCIANGGELAFPQTDVQTNFVSSPRKKY